MTAAIVYILSLQHSNCVTTSQFLALICALHAALKSSSCCNCCGYESVRAVDQCNTPSLCGKFRTVSLWCFRAAPDSDRVRVCSPRCRVPVVKPPIYSVSALDPTSCPVWKAVSPKPVRFQIRPQQFCTSTTNAPV
jgi:hypothetical protein